MVHTFLCLFVDIIYGLLLEIRYRHLPPRLGRAAGSANATFRVIVSYRYYLQVHCQKIKRIV